MRTNLIKTKELPKVAESPATDGMLDMVIAFDTTGSMSAYINAVKTHVKELVPKLFGSNPDLRIGIVAIIDKAKKQKKSMAEAYKLALEHIQNNPIKDFIEGEDRVLRGYKMQFVSRDGKYKCMDMDVVRGPKETGERLVNINTIKQLIFNGVKYVVE